MNTIVTALVKLLRQRIFDDYLLSVSTKLKLTLYVICVYRAFNDICI